MGKIYKGYELMWAVSKGLLNTTQKVSTTNREYMNCTIESILSSKVSDIMNLDFVLIEKVKNTNNIKGIQVDENKQKIGKSELLSWTGRALDFVLTEKINELVQVVNQIRNRED